MDYAWAETTDGPEAISVACVFGVNPDEVARRLQCDPRTKFDADFNGAEAEQDYVNDRLVVQFDQFNEWVVVIEPNGFLCSLPSVLAALSQGGHALSVYWNVNALMTVVYAVDGEVERYFDALLLDGTGAPMSEEADLPFGHPGSPRAAMLALVERRTGLKIDRNWLSRQRETMVAAIRE